MLSRLCWQIRARVWQYTIHFDVQLLSTIVLFTTTLSYSSTDDYDQHYSCFGVKRLLTIYNKILTKASAHVRESGFCNPWNVEPGILCFGMRNTAQRIRNPTKDWNPIQGSTRKNWNQVSGIRNPRCGIQNPRLSWIPLHETKSSTCQKLLFTYLLNATSFHQS